ncbi:MULTISPECIES: fimbrial biogenesis chaperone [unclassified Microbulbifer]|uniref:fimbrial biogenesis chaperone n=1 Tax=unclassified Microbulbifer TaxID=2619833 RepID=UPI001E4611D5|nr:fimbria/pilus periplasmic chaperone [Microbulbifer sp. YPW16]UHQ54766.1 fimbria/pilus periplasmic chaperone [Microbulbifer sp. YPW16]
MNYSRSPVFTVAAMKRFLVVALLMLAQPALAAMSLDKIIVYLNDQPNSRDDIVVSNPDEETLYLQTEIYRVEKPGMADEKRVRVVDPKEFRLLVNPARAVLAPGEQKRFRLMSLERDLEQEVVYRVTFKPVVGEVKSNRSALKILVAYQALVFVQPHTAEYRFELERNAGGLQLVNRGNINGEVAVMEYCESPGNCRKLSHTGRVYAGASLPIDEALADGELRLLVRGQQSERLSLPVPAVE